jgi:hypothetical protein
MLFKPFYFVLYVHQGGQVAAWVLAIGVVFGAQYYQQNKGTGEIFTKDEQEKWNTEKKAAADAAKKQ